MNDTANSVYFRFFNEVDDFLLHKNLEETWHLFLEEWMTRVQEKLDGCELVLLSPHSMLWSFPLHAIKIKGQALLTHFPIAYVDSLYGMQEILQKEKGSINHCFSAGVALVAPDDVYFEGEAKVVAQLFDTEAHLGRAVTRLLLLDQMTQKDVIHLSVHGDWSWASTELVLNFESERLTAADLLRVDISANLVFLSSCNGSWFNPDKLAVGIEGLPTAFLEAGAQSVIAPNWSIVGAASLQITAHFYQGLLQGQSKAKALQQAQLQLYQKEYYEQHTFYCSPFSLMGDWR